MKKRFHLSDLDCAHCAAKMEDAIRKIDGVHSASVNFLSQKLSIDADDARFDGITREVESTSCPPLLLRGRTSTDPLSAMQKRA